MHADENPFAEADALARAKLTTETAKIEWRALQRVFAAGKAIEGLWLVELDERFRR